MSVHAPTEARPAAPAAEPEDVDRAVAAARAAEKALAAEPAQKAERSRSQVRHDAEMERLSLHRMTVHSEALRAAIDVAMALKQRTHDLAKVHIAADDAADRADDEACSAAEAAWQASRTELDTAALVVAHAPFSDLNDVVARAEAFAEIVGRPAKDAPPEFDEDHILMLGSYRQAVLEMLERQPGRGDWEDAVAGLREIDRQIEVLDASEAGKDRLNKAYATRNAAITDLLSMQPPHLDGLLVLMEIVFQEDGPGVQSYAGRANAVGTGQLSAADLLTDGADRMFRGLALIAQHTARLRDLELPRDWRGAMRDLGSWHPGAQDAVRQAFDRGMHLPNLKAVQLAGKPDHELPVLVFSGSDGDHWIGPDKAYRGEMIG